MSATRRDIAYFPKARRIDIATIILAAAAVLCVLATMVSLAMGTI